MIAKVNVEEVKQLAIESTKYFCPVCNVNHASIVQQIKDAEADKK